MSTTPDLGEPGPARDRRRWVIIVAGVMVVVAVVAGIAVYRHDGDQPVAGVTVTWGGGEGDPPCVYDSTNHTVEAKVTIDGEAPPGYDVTVTVTAYADENTSKPVGSSTRSVQAEGRVHMPLVLDIPVDKAPFIDDDGITACSISVK